MALLAELPTRISSNKYRIYCLGARGAALTVTRETHPLKTKYSIAFYDWSGVFLIGS
jgi:hypothetical protein